MILLDTNVVSELRKVASGRAHANVDEWQRSVESDLLTICAITVQEVEFGILLAARADQDKARVLRAWFEQHVLTAFEGRILPFDMAAALRCAELNSRRTLPARDGMIAAIALTHKLTLATRNARNLAATGVRLIDPWAYRVGTGSGPDQS